ncbi:MAG TPA: rhodanese-like domain-containing protein [Verrucomicrobiae bacterium]|nr:rhodanese-like domain-containing protein [Verrucomicrobiae bacterium]
MNWPALVIVSAAMLGLLLWKRASLVSSGTARQLLQEGALVIDVRTPGEFSSGHLAAAVNIPLGDLRTDIPRHVPDKNQVLLLHCLSGGRSAIAQHQLKRMGYTKVSNLGSYRRAAAIVSSAGTE